MAEHNGGNRDQGGRRDGSPFRGNNNSGGQPRGFRARDDRPARDGGERKPYGDRPAREGGPRQEWKPREGGERKPYGDRPAREGGPRQEWKSREGGERKSFGDRGPRQEWKPREGGERKPYGDRSAREGGPRQEWKPREGGERKPYGDRSAREGGPRQEWKPREGGERKSFGDRGPRQEWKPREGGERKPYGDRPAREGGPRQEWKPREGGERKPYGDRPAREGGPRQEWKPREGGERKPYGDRPAREGGPRQEWKPREDRPAPTRNAGDLRSANRPDRERSPEIDEDVTGTELDRVTRAQLRTLETVNNEWVSKHLVMAGRLIDDEPELAFQHALAASRRGGRLAAVREAVGLTAYAAGHYGEALREFRTYRRISGSNEHLPVMADCERGLGRPDRALDVARSEDAATLDTNGKVEMAIVASGARADLGELEAAVAALEIPQLDINRAFSYSPRLFRAYGDALTAVGRKEEGQKWTRQAAVAEKALGIDEDDDDEPFIVDLDEGAESAELLPAKAVSSQPEPKEASEADQIDTSESTPDDAAADNSVSDATHEEAGEDAQTDD